MSGEKKSVKSEKEERKGEILKRERKKNILIYLYTVKRDDIPEGNRNE